MPAQVWPQERTDRLNELTLLGWSSSKIGQELGVTRNAVIGKWNRSGIRKRCADLMPDRTIAIVRRHRAREVHSANQAKAKAIPTRHDPFRPIKTRFRERFQPQPALTSPNPKRLIDLEHGDCRFPISPHFSLDYLFCGNPKLERQPYCDGHCWIAFNHAPRGSRPPITLPVLWCPTT